MTFPEMPRHLVASSEWVACVIYILFLNKRLKGTKLVSAIGVAFFAFQGYHVLIADKLPLFLWIPGMVVAILLMYTFFLVSCDIDLPTAAYWWAQAFIVAEFVASLQWQLFYYINENFSLLNSPFRRAAFFQMVFLAAFMGAYFLERRLMGNETMTSLGWSDFSKVGTIALTVFIASNISFVSANTPISGRYAMEIFYIRTLVDLCGVLLLYVQREGRYRLHANLEITALQNVLNRQYNQYRFAEKNMEALKHKHHDLKHQIAIIRAEKDEKARESYLEGLEETISNYEVQHNTGNSVLDTILADKSLTCVENGIQFTCVVHGELLGFMDTMDICSIFGNALDNAIEGSTTVIDREKRFISLSVFPKNRFIFIRFENPFEHELRGTANELLTTKRDDLNHGYGIKSIKRIAERYGGSVMINTDKQIFTLCVLIPM